MVTHPVRAETGLDLIRGQHLRIDEVVQTHVLEEFLVLRKQVLVVVDTGQGTFGTQTVGYQTGCHVLRLMRSDGDEQVAVLDAYLTLVMDRSGVTHFREHVVVGAQVA